MVLQQGQFFILNEQDRAKQAVFYASLTIRYEPCGETLTFFQKAVEVVHGANFLILYMESETRVNYKFRDLKVFNSVEWLANNEKNTDRYLMRLSVPMFTQNFHFITSCSMKPTGRYEYSCGACRPTERKCAYSLPTATYQKTII